MIVFACEKCRYTDLFEENENALCPRCGGKMVSLGINSADWNMLAIDEIYDLISEKVGTDYGFQQEDNPVETSNNQDERSFSGTEKQQPEPWYYRGDDEKSDDDLISFHTPHVRVNRKIVGVESAGAIVYDKDNYDYKTYLNSKNRSWGIRKSVKVAVAALVVIVAGIAIVLGAKYSKRGIDDDQGAENDISYTTTGVLESLPEETGETPTYEFINCLYYESMGEKEKELYQLFYDLVMHKDDADYSRDIKMPLFEFKEIEDKIDLVFIAMLRDHPEFFYITVSDTRLPSVEVYSDNISSVVIFKLGPADKNENEMIAKFDSAVTNFMRTIDKSMSDEEIELQIHDKLNEMVSYDRELIAIGLDGPDLAHTAYGALVDNGRGGRHRAVCDGYAQAYQYLLGKAGICAAQVTGEADTPGGTLWGDAYHAWNIVRLGGEWYEVDCCWDDLEIDELRDFYLEKEIKKIDDKYFYTTHHWFNRTTEEMKHLPASERTRFFIPGYESFNFIEETSHIRQIRPEEEWYRSFEYLNNYLPEATGTKYAL